MRQIKMTSAHNGYAAGDVLTIDDAKAGLPGFIDSGVADAFVSWARTAIYLTETLEERKDDKMLRTGHVKVKAPAPIAHG